MPKPTTPPGHEPVPVIPGGPESGTQSVGPTATTTSTGAATNLAPQIPSVQNPSLLGLDFMRQVTPNELVNNQLNALLQSNSAYMRNAELRGRELANNRGLLNSSIAAGNAQRASLEAAMPIAQADAQVYRDANDQNFQSLSQLRQMRVASELQNWLENENLTPRLS